MLYVQQARTLQTKAKTEAHLRCRTATLTKLKLADGITPAMSSHCIPFAILMNDDEMDGFTPWPLEISFPCHVGRDFVLSGFRLDGEGSGEGEGEGGESEVGGGTLHLIEKGAVKAGQNHHPYMGRGALRKHAEASKLRHQLAASASVSTTTGSHSVTMTESSTGFTDAPGPICAPKRGRGRPRKQGAVASGPSLRPLVVPTRRSSRSVSTSAAPSPSSTAVSSGYTSDTSDKCDDLVPVETLFQHIGAASDRDDEESSGSDSVEIDDMVESDDPPVAPKSKCRPKASTRAVVNKRKTIQKKAKADDDDDDMPVFDINIRVNDVVTGTSTPEIIKSSITWPELHELLSLTFNIHASNLHVQYRLSIASCPLTTTISVEP
ncbi:hypothetical protein M378DRAFT_17645 [Amanita muscaria Koide BX008]|uniref:Uncharacterized protein n=1 Tax=Amanita muscaria (strain Koide BX008) TaxID=946122 RepID=A0A0C2WI13_AMAMK|nr:hypothetical protein M378DRAFT_17645 [Amanita muscaria Koide BX008]